MIISRYSQRLLIYQLNKTRLWLIVFLALVAILRFGHLLRGVPGAMLALGSQIAAFLIVICAVRRQSYPDLGFRKFHWRWWIVSIGGGLALGSLLALLYKYYLPAPWDWIMAMDKSLLPKLWRSLPFGLTEISLAFIGGILTPVAEEFFFRGLLLSSWRKTYGIWAALIMQAFIFAFLHLAHVGIEIFPSFSIHTGLALNIFTATLIGGVLFGLIRIYSDSIWPAILAHAAVNLAAAVL